MPLKPFTQYPKLFEVSYNDVPKDLDVPQVIEYILKQICTHLKEFKEHMRDAYMVSKPLNGVHVTNLPTDLKRELYHRLRPMADNGNMLPPTVGIQEVTFIDTQTLGIILRLPQAERYRN